MKQELVALVARAICKEEFSSVPTYGDEICCQYGKASCRYEGGENLEACGWESFIETAQAALTALSQTHAIVPREPTEASIANGVMSLIDANLDGPDGVGHSDAIGVYKAMIQAAEGEDG